MEDGVARGKCRGELPHGHEDREVPGDDLAHHTQRLMEVVRRGVFVQLGQVAFLGTDRGGEVAEVVRREGNVRVQGFPDRLAVVPRLGHSKQLDVLIDPVGDLVQDRGAFRGRSLTPGRSHLVRGVQCQLDVLGRAPGHLAEGLPGHRGDVLEVLPLDRGNPLPADPVLVTVLERDLRTFGTRLCINSHL
jgi:hypothetical protein